mgnify:CR=1 FL=1
MIEFKNVTKRYGTNVAVDDVSFKINEGEFFILIKIHKVKEKIIQVR